MGHKAVYVAVDRGELNRGKVSPDPAGNRAQRRAWAKLTKGEVPVSSPEGVDTNTTTQDPEEW
jgi:hypothetical protein